MTTGPPTTPTSGGDEGPLSSGQRQEFAQAGEGARKILSAGRVATFNGWTLGVFGAMVGLLAGGVLDHYLFNLTYPHMTSLLWIFIGIGMVTVEFVLGEEPAPAPAQLVPST